MKISCIIPTCDRPQYLPEAIKSVSGQTLTPFEIIVVNNGKGEVEAPSGQKIPIKTVDIMPYAGVSQARNFGAVLAEGDFLAFLDDDDLWNKDYLKNVCEALKNETQCTVSRLDILRGGKVLPNKNAYGKLNLKKLLISNPGVSGSNVVISRKLFFEVGGFDPLLPPSEDKALAIEIVKRNIPIKVLPDNQAILREHSGTRLFNHEKLADGTYFFIKKYHRLMDRRIKSLNYQKMYRSRYFAGEKIAFLPYALFALINKTRI